MSIPQVDIELSNLLIWRGAPFVLVTNGACALVELQPLQEEKNQM
jgi:hypothetical protein